MNQNVDQLGERLLETVHLEKSLAQDALLAGQHEKAWSYLFQTLGRFTGQHREPEVQAQFMSICLDFSTLCFRLGRGFDKTITFLETAGKMAAETGDRRSGALIHLHMGRLYYFAERRHQAIELFARGQAEVEALGDEGMRVEAAEFIGLYYFVRGLFKEAMEHFELAAKSFEGEALGRVVNPSGPMWLSYCAAYLGQFHQATGTLDYYRRLALDRGDKTLASTYRAVLGLILMIMGEHGEAHFHLTAALQEAVKNDNALARYFAKGGLACHHLLHGRVDSAREWLSQTVDEGASSGLIRQYASPFVLEMLFDLHRQGGQDLPQINFPREARRIMAESNVHLQGVVLRLKATEAAAGQSLDEAESLLWQSQERLLRSGDPVQLGKTRLELVRLYLRRGQMDKARGLAHQALRAFSGYEEKFYPDDLRNLLTSRSDLLVDWTSTEEFLHLFMETIGGLAPSTDLDLLLTQTVAATNRLFGAERGGIFWFGRKQVGKAPRLRGACNLSAVDVAAEEFRSSLSLVFKTQRENRPQVLKHVGGTSGPSQIKAILCVPFEVSGRVLGVLYHDNSYVNDCFQIFGQRVLAQVANNLAKYIDNIVTFTKRLEERAASSLQFLPQDDSHEIIHQSRIMGNILAQADRVAETDSTVLILGETGVGKELLAHRLHRASPRRDRPLVIVDPTTITENLVESELFGHEKGSFTGADRQKIGRLELAHRGTLFIDEVGEIPKSIQVKLLRALQEKAISRVGGNHGIRTNFRLIAATNRDLAAEVGAGRFREDLYYRLNVVPLVLPPLRERGEDIILLAEHFLERFTAKYNRPGLRLWKNDKDRLLAYDWPGNVRELKNVIERAVLLSTGEDLGLNLPRGRPIPPPGLTTDGPTLDEMQRRYILHVINLTNGKIGGPGGAAEILGMKRTSLINRMKKLGIS